MQNSACLEEKLDRSLFRYDIKNEHHEDIREFLTLIKNKDPGTYLHSIRVGLLAAKIGDFVHANSKALLFSGLLHDVGKTRISEDVMKRSYTPYFSIEDMAEMKNHVKYSHDLLKGRFPFTADLSIRHHRYQKSPYPDDLPNYTKKYSNATQSQIDYLSRILALADFYDAFTTRTNSAFNTSFSISDNDHIEKTMLDHNQDMRPLIEDLFRQEIFKKPKREITEGKEVNSSDLILSPPIKNISKKIQRDVAMAIALEPLAEKKGCTTRIRNASRHLKLEYFIASAQNIAPIFGDLVTKIERYEKGKPDLFPPFIYGSAYEAQRACSWNHAGGRMLQGMIEMLVPIVASYVQLVFRKDYASMDSNNPNFVLENGVQVMKSTMKVDVECLVEMKRIAYDLSGYVSRTVPEHKVNTVYDYYKEDLKHSTTPTSIAHNGEFVNGFPAIRAIYGAISNRGRTPLLESLADAYHDVQRTIHRNASPGVTADCCGAALFLLYSIHSDKILLT